MICKEVSFTPSEYRCFTIKLEYGIVIDVLYHKPTGRVSAFSHGVNPVEIHEPNEILDPRD